MMLSKGERNKIYQPITGSGYAPTEFHLEDYGNKVTIAHASGARFEFSLVDKSPGPFNFTPINPRDEYDVEFSVPDGVHKVIKSYDIDTIATAYLRQWLEEIRLTVDQPDYWAEIGDRGQLLSGIQQEPANTPFTQDEQRQIRELLGKIQTELVEQSQLTHEQIAEVSERLKETAEASERMGRKDWLIYLLGTITALIITATVTAGIGENIFTIVITALAHLFTGGTEPPRLMS
jgi:hypothetical protein